MMHGAVRDHVLTQHDVADVLGLAAHQPATFLFNDTFAKPSAVFAIA